MQINTEIPTLPLFMVPLVPWPFFHGSHGAKRNTQYFYRPIIWAPDGIISLDRFCWVSLENLKQAQHLCEFPVVAGGALAQCLGTTGSGHPGWFAQVGPWMDVTCFLPYIRNSHPHPSRSDLGPWMNSKVYFIQCLCASLGVFTWARIVPV